MMDDQDCIGKSRGRGREEGWKDTSHTMIYHDKKNLQSTVQLALKC